MQTSEIAGSAYGAAMWDVAKKKGHARVCACPFAKTALSFFPVPDSLAEQIFDLRVD